MLNAIDWTKIFNNHESKKDLIQLVCCYFQTEVCANLFEIPLMLWSITKETITKERPTNISRRKRLHQVNFRRSDVY